MNVGAGGDEGATANRTVKISLKFEYPILFYTYILNLNVDPGVTPVRV